MKQKLDHIWGNQPQAPTVDLTPINNKLTQLETKVNQVDTKATTADNKATSISNVAAKTNVENTFTANQTINGVIKSSGLYSEEEFQTIAKSKKQTSKYMTFDFEQNNTGFRNYCGLLFRFKYGTDANYSNIFTIESRDRNRGVVITAESNKIILQNNITLEGVATPTADSHGANKEYVDRIKSKIKEIAAASRDFNEFKTKIGQW